MDSLNVYRELADCYDRLGQASMRDRFLILAADAAMEASQPSEAERLRQRLLQGSRHHMLRPYASFAEAVLASDVQTYLRDLRLNYPLEVARQLLESLKESNTPPKAPLHETAPLNEILPAPIPPTMPLMDTSGPARTGPFGGQRPQQRAAPLVPEEAPSARPVQPETYPLRDEPIPTAPPPARPLARPAGNRPAAPLARPTTPQRLAETAPVQRPAAPARPAPVGYLPPAPAAPREEPAQGGGWLNLLLAVVVFAAGIALLVSALARPLLPASWLP
jgi:hypothetical protein